MRVWENTAQRTQGNTINLDQELRKLGKKKVTSVLMWLTFHLKGCCGNIFSYIERADVTLVLPRSGRTPGINLLAESCTQPVSALVTMWTSPKVKASSSRLITDASSARKPISVSWHVILDSRLYPLLDKWEDGHNVSSQSKRITSWRFKVQRLEKSREIANVSWCQVGFTKKIRSKTFSCRYGICTCKLAIFSWNYGANFHMYTNKSTTNQRWRTSGVRMTLATGVSRGVIYGRGSFGVFRERHMDV